MTPQVITRAEVDADLAPRKTSGRDCIPPETAAGRPAPDASAVYLDGLARAMRKGER